MQDGKDIRKLYTGQEDYSNFSFVDRYGFIVDESNDKTPSSKDPSIKDLNRIKNEWHEILDLAKNNANEFKKIIRNKKLMYYEIPYQIRARVWKILLCGSFFSTQQPSLNHSNSIFNTICKKLINPKIQISDIKILLRNNKMIKSYNYLANKESGYEYQIHVDIQRTFRSHYLFYNSYGIGQRELFNILSAFANYFEKSGYCQGMCDIGAMFLMNYSEIEAFQMMVLFFKHNNLCKLFDKSFSSIPLLLKIQFDLIEELVPEVIKYIDQIEIYFISWYLTLFTRFNIKMTLRVWDFMMMYGFKSIMYFVCAILEISKGKFKTMNSESIMLYISKIHEHPLNESLVADIALKFMQKLKYRELDL